MPEPRPLSLLSGFVSNVFHDLLEQLVEPMLSSGEILLCRSPLALAESPGPSLLRQSKAHTFKADALA